MNKDLFFRAPYNERDRSVMTELDLPSICHVLRERSKRQPNDIAFAFHEIGESARTLTYRQLDILAGQTARRLEGLAEVDDRALLVFPPGLEFLVAFFGCLYARVLAVPTTYPRGNKPASRLKTIQASCEAKIALSVPSVVELQENIEAAVADPKWIAIDPIEITSTSGEEVVTGSDGEQMASDDSLDDLYDISAVSGQQIAFLQYTSGSTAEPKGVMVSHRNVLHNLELIQGAFGRIHLERDRSQKVCVFWLPAYHDMGLIGTLLEPLYSGWKSVLMSPTAFLKSPEFWLQTISDEKATITGAPNFAFEHCVKKVDPEKAKSLDLSSLRLFFCGAEPIRWEALQKFAKQFSTVGFRDDVFYPCYGMAEATLMATGGDGAQRLKGLVLDRGELEHNRVKILSGSPSEFEQTSDDARSTVIVNCGHSHLNMKVAVVDPSSQSSLPENEIGEVWLAGPSIAQGYWDLPEETETAFLNGAEQGANEGEEELSWFRTGDLGFIHEGDLFVTGRIKDVIIIRGQNHYPQEIEQTVAGVHPALVQGGTAAFSIDQENAEELVIVQELDRHARNEDLEPIVKEIREAISREHELDVAAIVLVRQAQVPRTSSGKVQRQQCKSLYLARELKVIHLWERPSATDSPNEVQPLVIESNSSLAECQQAIEEWMIDWIASRGGEVIESLDRDTPFSEMGLDSISAVELSFELEKQLNVEITPEMAWDHPTPSSLAGTLAESYHSRDK